MSEKTTFSTVDLDNIHKIISTNDLFHWVHALWHSAAKQDTSNQIKRLTLTLKTLSVTIWSRHAALAILLCRAKRICHFFVKCEQTLPPISGKSSSRRLSKTRLLPSEPHYDPDVGTQASAWNTLPGSKSKRTHHESILGETKVRRSLSWPNHDISRWRPMWSQGTQCRRDRPIYGRDL